VGLTSIQWTRRSANPIRASHKVTGEVGWHCVKHSSGCANCYSETLNKRFGTKMPFQARSADEVQLFFDPHCLKVIQRMRNPGKVFVCDMTDLFMEDVKDEWIDLVFAYAAVSPRATYQILTKRADRQQQYMNDPATEDRVFSKAVELDQGDVYGFSWPLRNVWNGVSCEDQKTADDRIPKLLDSVSHFRFISAEPLLGPIDLNKKELLCKTWRKGLTIGRYLDLVIVGGESGRNARPCDIEWIRQIVEDCKHTETAVFVKQIGSKPYEVVPESHPWEVYCRAVDRKIPIKDSKGGDPMEWPEDLRVRELPNMETTNA
jgi:protein gp37